MLCVCVWIMYLLFTEQEAQYVPFSIPLEKKDINRVRICRKYFSASLKHLRINFFISPPKMMWSSGQESSEAAVRKKAQLGLYRICTLFLLVKQRRSPDQPLSTENRIKAPVLGLRQWAWLSERYQVEQAQI